MQITVGEHRIEFGPKRLRLGVGADEPAPYEHLRLRPVTPFIGAEISGVDLADPTPEQIDELKRALLEAYHGRGERVDHDEVLLAAVATAGLDMARAGEILAGDEFAAEVREAEAMWQRAGIHSVPAVVINERHLISGGQPPEVFEQALRKIAQTD